MNFIIWLVVGGLIGWIASMIMKTDAQQGVILNVVVGIIGGFLGGWLLPQLGFAMGGTLGFLITAFVGAVVLLLIVNLFTRGKAR